MTKKTQKEGIILKMKLGNKQAKILGLVIINSALMYYANSLLSSETTINNAFMAGFLYGVILVISTYIIGTFLIMLINLIRVRWKEKK